MKRVLIALAAFSLLGDAASAASLLNDAQLDLAHGGAVTLDGSIFLGGSNANRARATFPSGGISGLNLKDSVRPIDYAILTGQISLGEFVLGGLAGTVETRSP
jgi:hypothetical protein